MPTPALVLVSASPRRAHLLRLAGLDFTVRPSEIEEARLPGEPPGVMAERLAVLKARALPHSGPPALAIAADTIVTIDDVVLGKPLDPGDARRMLGLLAGRTHEVITALALRTLPEDTIMSERSRSRVTFAPMSGDEIDWYVRTREGMDKAGAYALQGIGSLFVQSIEGSYTNVIGLPLERLYPHLRRFGLLPSSPVSGA